MQIQELLTLAQNKLSHLNNRLNSLISEWDLEWIDKVNIEIEETENTIKKLQSI